MRNVQYNTADYRKAAITDLEFEIVRMRCALAALKLEAHLEGKDDCAMTVGDFMQMENMLEWLSMKLHGPRTRKDDPRP